MAEYAELHVHSNFSFLDGASHPEELVAEAARLGLQALALTDHDGLYGVVRFAEAAREAGVPTVFGAELTLGLTSAQRSVVDPGGHHLVVLARDPQGYALLSRAIANAHLTGGSKGRPLFDLASLAAAHQGHWLVTTACRKGTVAAALASAGPSSARRALDELIAAFGRENVAVELWNHDDPIDSARNNALARLAISRGTELIATSNVHYATPSGHALASALAAVRSRRTLDKIDPWLPAGPGACLRSGAEQSRRFARFPGVVERSGELGRALAFDLRLIAPGLPPYPTPTGHDEMSYLRELVAHGADDRYGPRGTKAADRAWSQLDHELTVIKELGFPGYFLVVWDIVQFCRDHDIYCQGRGSAANSAVCYALGITNADAVALGLLFERFLSAARASPPDIDLDIESNRREEVIQYVYKRYGRHHAAQVANVICYRSRSSIRDSAGALGYTSASADAWSRSTEGHGRLATPGASRESDDGIPAGVRALAAKMEGIPRHLGVHSGGMVVCDRPVVEVCPVEWATAPGRTVLQWDKDDCAAVGLVKFDLLGLGMLEALHRMIDLIACFHAVRIDLAKLPQEPEVYEMLCRADTVGVFQVESRAQMATLPRLRPATFYDLVVEVALIRPGPIQGNSVHPYLRRRNKEEDVTYPHPLLERCLRKTLGVPLFQEQLMQMAIDVAGFTPTEADELRQAMSSKRSAERMEALRSRFYAGMALRSITGGAADEIFSKMSAFANFGFPESHAISFAYLVYASAWLKLHYPAAFTAGLLNSQPMGFWAPRTLIADASRHGVEVRRADVNSSGPGAQLEAAGSPGSDRSGARGAIRLGLSSIRGIGTDTAERIAASSPYKDLEDLVEHARLSRTQMEALAISGATASLDGGNRRRAIWVAGAIAQAYAPARAAPKAALRGTGQGRSQGYQDRFEGTIAGSEAPPFAAMEPAEEVIADVRSTGVSVSGSLTGLARPQLEELGVVPAAKLHALAHGQRVRVAGIVTHRQRPETARGVTFVNLEDETGLVNVICSIGVWARYRSVAQSATALVVRGRVESAGGVVNIVAERIDSFELAADVRSRDFC